MHDKGTNKNPDIKIFSDGNACDLRKILGIDLSYGISSCQTDDALVIVQLHRLSVIARCPECGSVCTHTRGSRMRELQDLPVAAKGFVIMLNTRKFKCDNDDCQKKYFYERHTPLADPYKRMTTRCMERVASVSVDISGNKASGILREEGIITSRNSCVRSVLKKIDSYEVPKDIKRVGIDDFAKKKGRTYGSLIVNHDTHRPIDLIDSRQSEDVEKWFIEHPCIEYVSRDRGECFIKGITPLGIKQISDRFHLLKNISDEVMKYIWPVYLKYRTQMLGIEITRKMEVPVTELRAALLKRVEEISDKPTREKLQMWDGTHKMSDEGKTIEEIAAYYNIKRLYVVKHILHRRREANYTARQRRMIEFIDNTIEKIANAKTLNIERIFKDRIMQLPTLNRYLSPIIKWLSQINGYDAAPFDRTTENHALFSALFVPHRKCSNVSVNKFLEQNDNDSNWQLLKYICNEFYKTIMNKDGCMKLDDWIRKAETSGIEVLKKFSRGVRREYDSIHLACTSKLSNGLLEGNINKIKSIKRQMYGRASFQLLRAKVLLSKYG